MLDYSRADLVQVPQIKGGLRQRLSPSDIVGENADSTTQSARRRSEQPTTAPPGSENTQRLLACPFTKAPKPFEPSVIRSCLGHGWLTISRLKEHLMRTHYRRACEQCETQIRSGAKSNGHTCKMRRTYRHGNSAALRAMFDDRVAQQLKSRSRQWKRGSTSEEQWAKIFLLIFPDTRTQVPSPYMETPQLPQSHEALLIKSFVDCLSVSLRDLEHGISDSELERIMSIIRRESQRYIDDRNPGASGSSDSCSSRATADLPANEPPYMEADCVDQRTLAEEPPELDADEGSLGSFSFPSTQEDCANSSWEVVQGSAELLTVVQPTEDCLARTDGVWGHYDDHPLDAFDYPDLWSTISTAGETI